MTTRIYIPKEDMLTNKYPEYLLDALILQDGIDINFYDIEINRTYWRDNPDFLGYDYYIDYNLKRNVIWNYLEECKERLKIGL